MFFREFRTFVQELAPTKPVAFAPNNVRFHLYAEEWKTILPFIDILIPFAFARDPEHLNVVQMKQICDECGTHMWVDMEMFREPLYPRRWKRCFVRSVNMTLWSSATATSIRG